jgi:hypothetical protein
VVRHNRRRQQGKTQQENSNRKKQRVLQWRDTTGEQQKEKTTGVTMERHNRRTAKGK